MSEPMCRSCDKPWRDSAHYLHQGYGAECVISFPVPESSVQRELREYLKLPEGATADAIMGGALVALEFLDNLEAERGAKWVKAPEAPESAEQFVGFAGVKCGEEGCRGVIVKRVLGWGCDRCGSIVLMAGGPSPGGAS